MFGEQAGNMLAEQRVQTVEDGLVANMSTVVGKSAELVVYMLAGRQG